MHNYDNVEFEKRFNQMVDYCMKSGRINLNLYTEYDVKRGLRDSNGNGVLTGLMCSATNLWTAKRCLTRAVFTIRATG